MSDPQTTPGTGNGSEATPPNTVTLPAAEVEQLRQQATERQEYLDLARRTQAEFENYQKRNARDREQERALMVARLMGDLLPVLDNLERALTAAEQKGETGDLVKGVALVRGQMLDLLRRHGVTPIDAQIGQPFDPNLHQGLTQAPSADYPANSILMVAEQGYKLGDRVLRPAKVVVSMSPKEEGGNAEG